MKSKKKPDWAQIVKDTRELLPKFKDDPLSEIENYVTAIIEGNFENNQVDIKGCLAEVLKNNEDGDAMLGFVTQITDEVERRCKIIDAFMDEWSNAQETPLGVK